MSAPTIQWSLCSNPKNTIYAFSIYSQMSEYICYFRYCEIRNTFLNGPFPASFSLFRLFYKQLTVYSFNKSCRWLDSNPGPLVAEATALPTVPQQLPTKHTFVPTLVMKIRTLHILGWSYIHTRDRARASKNTFYPFQNKHQIHWDLQIVKKLCAFKNQNLVNVRKWARLIRGHIFLQMMHYYINSISLIHIR